jgi:HAD superfamily hydrolase (TIGR01490 family)
MVHDVISDPSQATAQIGKSVVAAFDFDVTMTTRDTFLPFLYRVFGKKRVRGVFLKLAADAVLVGLGLSTRDRFKEKIVRALFLGESIERISDAGRMHAEEIIGWIRPQALTRIQWHRDQGHRLVMVSASLGLYLEPLTEKLGFDDLLCTNPSRNHLVFDGGLEGKNCRGPEKVSKLTALLGPLSSIELYAYGDSAGDREMLEVADYPNYRAFEV